MVPITRLATIGGVPVTDLISPDRLKEIEDRTRFAGGELVKLFGIGSAFYAPAQCAIEMAESFLKDKKRVIYILNDHIFDTSYTLVLMTF